MASAADVSIPTMTRLEASDGPLGGRGRDRCKNLEFTRRGRRRIHRRKRWRTRGAPQKSETRGAEEVEVVIFLVGLIAATSGLGLGVREPAAAAKVSIDTVARFEEMN